MRCRRGIRKQLQDEVHYYRYFACGVAVAPRLPALEVRARIISERLSADWRDEDGRAPSVLGAVSMEWLTRIVGERSHRHQHREE